MVNEAVMKTISVISAWGILYQRPGKRPYLISSTIRRTRKEAIETLTDDMEKWRKLTFYRCVRVSATNDLAGLLKEAQIAAKGAV